MFFRFHFVDGIWYFNREIFIVYLFNCLMKFNKKRMGVVVGLIVVFLIFLSFSGFVVNNQTIKNFEAIESVGENEGMRFATYNMMFGMYGRSAVLNLLGHFSFHGVHSVTLTKFFSRYNDKDVEFVSKMSPDIVSLNEVLGTLKKEEIVSKLRERGFEHFCWGVADHYESPMDIGTLIASKYEFEKLSFKLPMSDHFGGGGGACAVYIKKKNLSILAVHLGLDSELLLKQLKAVSGFVEDQKKKKRKVILMGDFNLEEQELDKNKGFKNLNLTGANKKDTSPDIDIIKRFNFKSVDNIFYDSSFKLKKSGVVDGYSDHRLVWADLI